MRVRFTALEKKTHSKRITIYVFPEKKKYRKFQFRSGWLLIDSTSYRNDLVKFVSL